MSATERRPRIDAGLAERIDRIRGDVPFERWVRGVLTRVAVAEEFSQAPALHFLPTVDETPEEWEARRVRLSAMTPE